VRERFNYSVFAAAYYGAALLHLMRHRVDAEMFWVGTEDQGGYGMLNKHANPWPSYHAKSLVTRHVRDNDSIFFPTGETGNGNLDLVVACGPNGRRSVVIIHQREESATYHLEQLVPDTAGLKTVRKMDEGSQNSIAESSFDGRVRFDGFGVAAVTTEATPR
jgi:hypothetical protein